METSVGRWGSEPCVWPLQEDMLLDWLETGLSSWTKGVFTLGPKTQNLSGLVWWAGLIIAGSLRRIPSKVWLSYTNPYITFMHIGLKNGGTSFLFFIFLWYPDSSVEDRILDVWHHCEGIPANRALISFTSWHETAFSPCSQWQPE